MMILEVPEIELYRLALAERTVGTCITAVERADANLLQASEEQLEREIIGRAVWFVERRGKHLLFHLDNGKRLLLHLSSNVRLTYGEPEDGDGQRVQAVIRFGDTRLNAFGLRANDLQLLSVKGVEELMGGYGPDPLDKRLTQSRFIDLFAKKRGTLKTALADQHMLSGIGAVYADEIAYRAAIRPDIKIPQMTLEQWERVYEAMHSVLQEAISNGGLNEWAAAFNNESGAMSMMLRVYDREGQACYNCDTPIEKIQISSKKAFLCPICQKEE